MRTPHRALARLPTPGEFKNVVRPLLLMHLEAHGELCVRAADTLQGAPFIPEEVEPPVDLSAEAVEELRVRVAAAVGEPRPPRAPA